MQPRIIARKARSYRKSRCNSIALREYAVAREPLNPGGQVQLGVQYRISLALLLQGDAAGALAATEMEAQEGWGMVGLAMHYHALGRKRESDAVLAELISTYERDFPYNIAYVMAYRPENDRAFGWLAKAVLYRDPGVADIVVEPQFAKIRQDPRWLPFLQKIGKAPEQLAAIKFEVTVPR